MAGNEASASGLLTLTSGLALNELVLVPTGEAEKEGGAENV